MQPAKTERRAIVMLSAGDRPWFPLAARTFEIYAERCGADFIVETELPTPEEFPLGRLPATRGRANKLAYASKTFFAWKHLRKGYDRLLFVDDTCVVRLNTPDVFDIVPFGELGGVGTGVRHARLSFEEIRRFTERAGYDPVDFKEKQYLNSGFLVYDRTMIDAIAPERVIDARRLLMSKLPHQTLTYYLIRSAGIRTHVLPRLYNTVPAARLPKEERRYMTDILPHLSEEAFVFHLTGIYRNRGALIAQIVDKVLSETAGSEVPGGSGA